MTPILRAIRSFYQKNRYGNVYDNLFFLMKLSSITGEKLMIKNVLLFIWLAVHGIRFLIHFLFMNSHQGHFMGQSLNPLGSQGRLLIAAAAVCLFQLSIYRAAVVVLIRRGHLNFRSVLHEIRNEADAPKRIQKEKFLRYLLLSTIVIQAIFLCSDSALFTVFFAVNVWNSGTWIQVCCWCFWWLIDLLMTAAGGLDMAVFPCLLVLIVNNYKMDMRFLIERINQLATATDRVTYSMQFDQMLHQYKRLARSAVIVNQMSASILFAITLCTTPYLCEAAFALDHAENLFIRIIFIADLMTPGIQIAVTLGTAAGVTTLVSELRGRLFNQAATADHKTLRHKIMIQRMLEETGSEDTLFALYTLDGFKYTPEMLLYYVIELMLHYTLLITFEKYLI